MMQLIKNKIWFIAIFLFLSNVVFIITQINLSKKLEEEKNIGKQNILAFNNEMERIAADTLLLFQKYAKVLDTSDSLSKVNKDLQSVLNDKEEKILIQSSFIIGLKSLKDTINAGTNVQDNNIIPQNLIGVKLPFSRDSPVYNLNANVILDNPSRMYSEINIKKFTSTIHITRNDAGKYSGYLSFSPKEFNEYLNIEKLDIILDRDDYLRIENAEDKTRIDIFPSIGLLLTPEVYIKAGIDVIINDHLFGYENTIGLNYHGIRYGRKFTLF